jgi:hypothetical protein
VEGIRGGVGIEIEIGKERRKAVRAENGIEKVIGGEMKNWHHGRGWRGGPRGKILGWESARV